MNICPETDIVDGVEQLEAIAQRIAAARRAREEQ